MSEPRHFLGVRRSVNGVAWVHALNPRQEMVAIAMTQGAGVSDVVRASSPRAAWRRGGGALSRPLDPRSLADPEKLTDMDAAAAGSARRSSGGARSGDLRRLRRRRRGSSALLKRFLGPLWHRGGGNLHSGPHLRRLRSKPEAMRDLASRGARLIVTVDCGTNSATSIAAAREAGADVVVLDHHQVGGALPPGIPVVNPNGRTICRGRGISAPPASSFLALVQTARRLRASRPDLPQRTFSPCSISWRWRRSATWCRSPGVNRATW